MSADRMEVIFRAPTAEDAQGLAKAWARAEGLRIRTVASVQRRPSLPAWQEGPAWCVTLVVVK